MAAFKDYTSICNSAPSEFLATVALKHRDAIALRNLEIIRNNLALLDDFFAQHQDIFNWTAPTAGPIAFPSINLNQDVESFCVDLVQKQGVLLLPGNYFDFDDKHFRIGFGRKNMPQALEQLEAYVKSNL